MALPELKGIELEFAIAAVGKEDMVIKDVSGELAVKTELQNFYEFIELRRRKSLKESLIIKKKMIKIDIKSAESTDIDNPMSIMFYTCTISPHITSFDFSIAVAIIQGTLVI